MKVYEGNYEVTSPEGKVFPLRVHGVESEVDMSWDYLRNGSPYKTVVETEAPEWGVRAFNQQSDCVAWDEAFRPEAELEIGEGWKIMYMGIDKEYIKSVVISGKGVFALVAGIEEMLSRGISVAGFSPDDYDSLISANQSSKTLFPYLREKLGL